jgi:hypothetical protein
MPKKLTRRNSDVYFDSGLQGWLKRTAKTEHWRVAGWQSVEDLVQEGYICYCKCRDRYTLGAPDLGHQDLCTDTPNSAQRKHFMSLVQRSFYNRVYTLAMRYPATREQPLTMCSNERGEPLSIEDSLPPQPEEISVLIAVLHAPTEISEAIVKLVNDGVDGSKYLRSRLRTNNGRVTLGRRALRETTQQHLVRILGDDELPQKVLAYLLA